MDRREALKKMMAGGAVVAGASMVSSSPVFAAGSVPGDQPAGPGLTTSPIPVLPTNDKRYAMWQITSPGVMCSTAGGLRVDSHAVVNQVVGNLNVTVNPSGSTYVPGAGFITVTAIGTGPGNSPFRRGDAFEFTWSVRYVCLDTTGRPMGYQCREYRYMYRNQANGNPNWQLAAMPMMSDTWHVSCPVTRAEPEGVGNQSVVASCGFKTTPSRGQVCIRGR